MEVNLKLTVSIIHVQIVSKENIHRKNLATCGALAPLEEQADHDENFGNSLLVSSA